MPRGTRGEAHPQPAFKVAHLAAGGMLLPRTLTIQGKVSHSNMIRSLFNLSPWTRLCLLGSMVPVTFLLYEAPVSLLPLGVIVPLGLTSGVAAQWLRRTLIALCPFVFLLGLVYLLAMPLSGEVVWGVGPVLIGSENAGLFFSILSRVVVMLSALLLFVSTTSASDLLMDLRRRGAPALAVYLLAMTVNLVPLFRHRAVCVMDAQKARGLDLDGGLFTRARRVIPLVAPLLLGALADVEKRAMALELRGGLRSHSVAPLVESRREAVLRLASCGIIFAALGFRVWMLFH